MRTRGRNARERGGNSLADLGCGRRVWQSDEHRAMSRRVPKRIGKAEVGGYEYQAVVESEQLECGYLGNPEDRHRERHEHRDPPPRALARLPSGDLLIDEEASHSTCDERLLQCCDELLHRHSSVADEPMQLLRLHFAMIWNRDPSRPTVRRQRGSESRRTDRESPRRECPRR